MSAKLCWRSEDIIIVPRARWDPFNSYLRTPAINTFNSYFVHAIT